MRKLGLLLAFLLLATPVFATDGLTVNGHQVNGLTEAQIADLQAQAAKLAEQNTSGKATTSQTVKEVVEYAQLGAAFGTGLAARELGMAVNDFAETPIGRTATFVIVFKLVGKDFLHFFIGSTWFMVMVPLWTYFFWRMCILKAVITDSVVGENGKMQKIRKRKEYYDSKAPDEIHATRLVMACRAGDHHHRGLHRHLNNVVS